MATFAAKTFNAAGYLAARPVYPKVLYETIFAAHRGGLERAVDLGAGSGQVTQVLAERITGSVTALDPSSVMLEKGQAKLGTKSASGCHIEWKVGSAEDLSAVPDESIDLVVSGQAAHWFNHATVWKDLRRVLRPRGTVAYWGYGDMILPQYPSTKSTIAQYMYDDPKLLGPHWEQPGRNIVAGLYKDIPWPEDKSGWNQETAQRIFYTGSPGGRELIMEKTVDWAALEAYVKTFSSLHNFQTAHPEDADAPTGDIVARFVQQLKKDVKEASPDGEVPDTLALAWPLGLVSISKV